MNYKTIQQIYAVWISRDENFDRIKDSFLQKRNTCKFEKDFKLKNTYIDYDHAISLWLLDGDDCGFGDVVKEVKAECANILGYDNISYIFAVGDLEYNAAVHESETLVFLGNIKLHFKIMDIDSFFL